MPRKSDLQVEELAVSSPVRRSTRSTTVPSTTLSTENSTKSIKTRQSSLKEETNEKSQTPTEPKSTARRSVSTESTNEIETKKIRGRRSSAAEESKSSIAKETKTRRGSVDEETGADILLKSEVDGETQRVTRRRRSLSTEVNDSEIKEKRTTRTRRMSVEKSEENTLTPVRKTLRTRRSSTENSEETEPKTPKPAAKGRRRGSISLEPIEENTEANRMNNSPKSSITGKDNLVTLLTPLKSSIEKSDDSKSKTPKPIAKIGKQESISLDPIEEKNEVTRKSNSPQTSPTKDDLVIPLTPFKRTTVPAQSRQYLSIIEEDIISSQETVVDAQNSDTKLISQTTSITSTCDLNQPEQPISKSQLASEQKDMEMKLSSKNVIEDEDFSQNEADVSVCGEKTMKTLSDKDIEKDGEGNVDSYEHKTNLNNASSSSSMKHDIIDNSVPTNSTSLISTLKSSSSGREQSQKDKVSQSEPTEYNLNNLADSIMQADVDVEPLINNTSSNEDISTNSDYGPEPKETDAELTNNNSRNSQDQVNKDSCNTNDMNSAYVDQSSNTGSINLTSPRRSPRLTKEKEIESVQKNTTDRTNKKKSLMVQENHLSGEQVDLNQSDLSLSHRNATEIKPYQEQTSEPEDANQKSDVLPINMDVNNTLPDKSSVGANQEVENLTHDDHETDNLHEKSLTPQKNSVDRKSLLHQSDISPNGNKENIPETTLVSPRASKKVITLLNAVDKKTEISCQNINYARISDVFRPKGIENSFSEPMDDDESFLYKTQNIDETIAELDHSKQFITKQNDNVDDSFDGSFTLQLKSAEDDKVVEPQKKTQETGENQKESEKSQQSEECLEKTMNESEKLDENNLVTSRNSPGYDFQVPSDDEDEDDCEKNQVDSERVPSLNDKQDSESQNPHSSNTPLQDIVPDTNLKDTDNIVITDKVNGDSKIHDASEQQEAHANSTGQYDENTNKKIDNLIIQNSEKSEAVSSKENSVSGEPYSNQHAVESDVTTSDLTCLATDVQQQSSVNVTNPETDDTKNNTPDVISTVKEKIEYGSQIEHNESKHLTDYNDEKEGIKSETLTCANLDTSTEAQQQSNSKQNMDREDLNQQAIQNNPCVPTNCSEDIVSNVEEHISQETEDPENRPESKNEQRSSQDESDLEIYSVNSTSDNTVQSSGRQMNQELGDLIGKTECERRDQNTENSRHIESTSEGYLGSKDKEIDDEIELAHIEAESNEEHIIPEQENMTGEKNIECGSINHDKEIAMQGKSSLNKTKNVAECRKEEESYKDEEEIKDVQPEQNLISGLINNDMKFKKSPISKSYKGKLGGNVEQKVLKSGVSPSDIVNDKKLQFKSKGLKTNTDSEDKLDKFLATISSSSSDDEEDNYERNEFIDDEAEEGEEDTPSEDSNQIIDEGESLHSSDSDLESNDEYDSNDSFICNDEDHELLSGEEYDLGGDKRTKSKKSRIINVENNDSDVIIFKKKEKVITPKNKSRIIAVSSSSSDEDTSNIDFVSPKILKKSEDNSTEATSKTNTEKVRKSSITILENVNVSELKDSVLSERISGLVESFCTRIKKGDISMNLSLEYEGKASSDDSKDQSPTLSKSSVKRKSDSSESSSPMKKLKLASSLENISKPKPGLKRRLSKSAENISNINKKKKSHKKERIPARTYPDSHSIFNDLITDVRNRPKRIIKPSSAEVKLNRSWIVDVAEVRPSTSIVSKKELEDFKQQKHHPKDFRHQMLYNSSRVKREESKVMLRKRSVYY